MGCLNKYVYPVKEWFADALLIAGDQTRRAGALSKGVTIVATGACVRNTHLE